MGRTFSLATLLLLMAIAAIGLASTRTVLAGVWRGQAPEVAGLMFAGAIFGALFGLGFALWNRSKWVGFLGCIIGGPCLGAAAGAQLSVAVDWPVIFTTPIILISTLMVVIANRRWRFDPDSEGIEKSSER
jgi:hypothetical protein